MNSFELRQKYLDFFKKQGHAIIPSASLIPENDPTVLFTTAGMHPLVPYLMGEKHPEGVRLTNSQKCIRTGDIDEVGDDTHLTFFEMLGNWSLGDYWKEDAIKWSFEFLTKELNISLDRLAVSCFAGDENAPRDEESAKIWESLGIAKERIAFLPKEDNWWGPAGKTGPCGPDTEMFYWKNNNEQAPEIFDVKNKNWVEIWNNVFMQYVKDENGDYLPAKQKNVDTGMGLERTLAVLNGKENVYETDLFLPIIEKIEKLSGEKYENNKKVFRIIADHMKASVFLACEGIVPLNVEQGYVLRRLLRVVVEYGEMYKVSKIFFTDLIKLIVEIYKDIYPELLKKEKEIIFTINQEVEKFEPIIKRGIISTASEMSNLNYDPYIWRSTSGVPVSIIKDLWDKDFNRKEAFEIVFERGRKKHQDLSRTASAGMFKGGLADNSEATTKLHTSAHLMLAGLRKFLGDSVSQKGSNITAERLRFDFAWKEKVTPEQIKQVEDFVNEAILKDLSVICKEMSLDEAKEINATGVFEHKYGERVKVYFIGEGDQNISKEICGGPHVEHTGAMGKFKIIKEESSSAGVRRIKAILQ